MNEHQRRVWSRMLDALDSFEAGGVDLAALCLQLKGLLGASDLQDQTLVSEFWDHFVEIDMELELRTESWAPTGAASDERLPEATLAYQTPAISRP